MRSATSGRRGARAAAIGAVVAASQFAPMATANDRLRRRLWPALSGQGRRSTVALTFDDGPDPRSTPQILDELDRLGLSATFFVLGEMHAAAPHLTRELLYRGHEVGVHGWRHRSHPFRAPWAVARDLARSVDAHVLAAGEAPVWFRPPYGSVSSATLLAARRHHLRTVLWTVAGRDWRPDATGETVAANVEEHLEPGATVLLHDSDCTSTLGSWRSTLDALPRLAEAFEQRGLAAVTLSEHLRA